MSSRLLTYTLGILLSISHLQAQGELCNKSEKPEDEAPITLQQLSDLINTPDFYNPNYRYLDDLGSRGGKYSNGFLDTWLGETQIMFPYNGLSVFFSNTNTMFVGNDSNYLYWMSLAMGQEYLNVDMQWMMGVGAKETFSGTSEDPQTLNTEGAYGPFEVERFTGLDRGISYPEYFPKYQTQLENAADATELGSNFADEFMNNYIGIDKTILNEARTINGYFMSAINFFSIYNRYSYAKDVCWHKTIDNPADKFFGLGVMTVTYNLGFGGAESVKDHMTSDTYETTNTNPNAGDLLPPGNSNYRVNIREIVKVVLEQAQKASTDVSIPLWDYQIDWSIVERFFLGEGGTVNIQGKGGMFQHFHTNNTTIKQEVMTTLQAAFDTLKGKAPSSTTTTISFRYDWITLLRTVKQYFPNTPIFKEPTNGDTFLQINAAADQKGCCVETPEIILDQSCLNETTGFGLSNSVDTIAWEILDATNTILFSSTDMSGNYDFTIAGDYTIQATVTITDPDTKEVTTSTLSEIISFDEDPDSFDDRAEFQGNDIVVIPENTTGIIEYALDDIDGSYQDSTRFGNATLETHTIFIKRNGCITSIEVSPNDNDTDPNNPNNNPDDLLIIPEYFTPNGDGFHDTWLITDTSNTLLDTNSKIFVFDRYGKLLTQLIPDGSGWDGFYGGQQMPSSEYWFSLEYVQNNTPKRITGHFSLIR